MNDRVGSTATSRIRSSLEHIVYYKIKQVQISSVKWSVANQNNDSNSVGVSSDTEPALIAEQRYDNYNKR